MRIFAPSSSSGKTRKTGAVDDATTGLVKAKVIDVGQMLLRKLQEHFTKGPNDKHFIRTVLFSCQLPTIGFHSLVRTEHTDLLEAFWFKQNTILHSMNHLKYQKLYLFYAIFGGILPRFLAQYLFQEGQYLNFYALLVEKGAGWIEGGGSTSLR